MSSNQLLREYLSSRMSTLEEKTLSYWELSRVRRGHPSTRRRVRSVTVGAAIQTMRYVLHTTSPDKKLHERVGTLFNDLITGE